MKLNSKTIKAFATLKTLMGCWVARRTSTSSMFEVSEQELAVFASAGGTTNEEGTFDKVAVEVHREATILAATRRAAALAWYRAFCIYR